MVNKWGKRNLHRDKNIVVATIREQCQQGQIDRRGVINWISYDEEEEIHVMEAHEVKAEVISG